MANQGITADTILERVIDHYPKTAKVFFKHRLHCVGCPISRYHRVVDCVTENDLDLERFLAELREAAGLADDQGE